MSSGPVRLGAPIEAGIKGVGTAVLVRRFVGAPLGGFTGAAAGFLTSGIAGALGGYIADNGVPGVPGAGANSAGVPLLQ